MKETNPLHPKHFLKGLAISARQEVLTVGLIGLFLLVVHHPRAVPSNVGPKDT